MASNQKFSDRKVATHNRQKAILLLEKISKNMFRMFRDDETKKEAITKRFFELTKQLDKL